MRKAIVFGIILTLLVASFVVGCKDSQSSNGPPQPTVQSLSLNPTDVDIKVGGGMQYWASATYSNGSTSVVTDKVTWSSSDPAVATIGTGGLASGTAAGNTTITATLEWKNASATLTVTEVPPETVTIIDSTGREVVLPQPLESIVALHTDVAEAIRALGAKDRIIGITKYMAGKAEYWPDLADATNCGSSFTPNYEQIIDLNPQVVIVYSGTFGFSAPTALEERMEPAGIKVVKLDCYKPETMTRDVSTLGVMLGKEDRATEYITFIEGYLSTVNSRVKKLKADEKVRVYFEQWTNYKSVAEGAGYHDMILMAGGINVFAGAGVSYPIVSPEAILTEDPQLVIKNTQEAGYTATDASGLQAIRDALLARAGWANMDAVKNNKVYVVSNELVGGTKKPIAICYIAKWLYPDKFQDMDPEAMLREFMEEYQGIPYQGVYIYNG